MENTGQKSVFLIEYPDSCGGDKEDYKFFDTQDTTNMSDDDLINDIDKCLELSEPFNASKDLRTRFNSPCEQHESINRSLDNRLS